MHNEYCFADQSAPTGYFTNDLLPCICSCKESLLNALTQVAIPFLPLGDLPPVGFVLGLSA